MHNSFQTSIRKPFEKRETYEAILKRSQARFPDHVLPESVNFDAKIEDTDLKLQPFSEIDEKNRPKRADNPLLSQPNTRKPVLDKSPKVTKFGFIWQAWNWHK